MIRAPYREEKFGSALTGYAVTTCVLPAARIDQPPTPQRSKGTALEYVMSSICRSALSAAAKLFRADGVNREIPLTMTTPSRLNPKSEFRTKLICLKTPSVT